MSFVRSRDDIERMQRIVRRQVFSGVTAISCTALADREVVESLLPPPLVSTEPLLRFWIVDVQGSNVAGAFSGAGIDIAARHGDTYGWYNLAMPMNTDIAVQVGRELLGERKMLADVSLSREGDVIHGAVKRHGVPIMQLSVDPKAEVEPEEQDGTTFHYKCLLAADGSGYDAPPKLIAANRHLTPSRIALGKANLALMSGPHDAFGDLKLHTIRMGNLVEGEEILEASAVCEVDGDAYLPWAYGNTDDWLVYQEVQKRVSAIGAKRAASAE